MLKNRRYVKVVMAMMLSVTLLCAMCLPTYASVPHYIVEIDSANNMYYRAEIDGSVSIQDGIVFAACASTFVAPDDEEEPTGYQLCIVETKMTMYRDGQIIGSEFSSGVLAYENSIYVDVRTQWIVPDYNDPFDYVVTEHIVYSAEYVDQEFSDENGDSYTVPVLRTDELLWQKLLVFNYQNFLTQ